MKVTGMPWQQGLHETTIDSETGSAGFTVIETALDVAGFPVAQVISEVTWHTAASPFAGTYVKTGLFGPVLTPFTFHW